MSSLLRNNSLHCTLCADLDSQGRAELDLEIKVKSVREVAKIYKCNVDDVGYHKNVCSGKTKDKVSWLIERMYPAAMSAIDQYQATGEGEAAQGLSSVISTLDRMIKTVGDLDTGNDELLSRVFKEVMEPMVNDVLKVFVTNAARIEKDLLTRFPDLPAKQVGVAVRDMFSASRGEIRLALMTRMFKLYEVMDVAPPEGTVETLATAHSKGDDVTKAPNASKGPRRKIRKRGAN